MKIGSLVGVTGFLIISACNMQQVRVDDFRKNMLTRVAFEMNCPAADITVQDLSPDQGSWLGAQIGVQGCGKKSVYVSSAHNGWVNNTGVR